MAVDTLLPYDTVPDNEVEDKVIIDVDALNRADNNINERYDHSILNVIDPDLNYLQPGNSSLYYSANTFNTKFQGNPHLSLINCNIHSMPRNFKNLILYLVIYTLKHKSSIIYNYRGH